MEVRILQLQLHSRRPGKACPPELHDLAAQARVPYTVTHKEKTFDVTNETTSLRRMSTSAGRSKLHHLLLRCVPMVLSVARCDWYQPTRQNNVGGPMSISNIVPCAFTPASQTNDLSQHPEDVSLDWVKCVDFLCADEPAVLQPAITCVESDLKSTSIRGNISIGGRKSCCTGVWKAKRASRGAEEECTPAAW